MKINSQIPNTMTPKGLEYLARIASSIKKKNVSIVEAGSLYGCTAWVFSKNADKSVMVYAIDPWIHDGFLHEFKTKNHRVPDLSLHAFKAYTNDCHNIKAIQGFSPADIKKEDFGIIDVFFEDACHDYEMLKKNIEHFYPLVNPGGVICGDDYQAAYGGVIKLVDEFCASIGVEPEVCGQVWAIRKPLENQKNHTVYSKVGNVYETEIGVEILTENGAIYKSSPHCFTGNLFKPDRLTSISIFLYENKLGMNIEWGVKLSDGSEIDKLELGQTVNCENLKVVGIKARIVGKLRMEYDVGYQVGAFKDKDDPLSELGPSRERFNGSWLSVENDKSIYAISMSIVSKSARKARQLHFNYVDAGKAALLSMER